MLVAAKTRPVMILAVCASVEMISARPSAQKRSQQVFEVLLPIEWREIVNRFAGADKARGNAKFILDRHYDPAFAAAVELGDDQASESKRIVKLACLTECVAACGSIDDQQRFVRCVWIEFAQSPFYLL